MVVAWTARGAWRGFSRELFGLAALGCGVLVSAALGPDVAREVAARWSVDPGVAAGVARIGLFLVPFVTLQAVGLGVHRLGKALFLGGLDRFAGALFGAGTAVVALGAALTVADRWSVAGRWLAGSRLAAPLAEVFRDAATWLSRWSG